MTGLFNHTYFKIKLDEEANLFERKIAKSISLIMIDIDSFKHYNDANGHPAGDVVIKKIADILKTNTRKTDIAARYGGEEFVILLPNTPIIDAITKAEDLRRHVETTHFENEEKQPSGKITISVGVANMPWHCSKPEELLSFADKALYYSKNSGKNKVTEYSQRI